MSPTGWLTMIVSIGGVLAAAAWAYYKVLSTPKDGISGQPHPATAGKCGGIRPNPVNRCTPD